MVLLLGFAFLAGIVTILSPCILPVLPVVLSGGISGGKQRPLGIVAGFIASFTFFTLFLTSIVRATGISPDALRLLSVVIIIAFGLSLLIPKFQSIFERLATKLTSLVPKNNQRQDFGGGVLIGVSLGLVWTPCVGPILASVISLALTGTVTTTAFFITLAYSIGTAIPMLAIIWGGRQLLQKVPWLVASTGKIQKAFGVLMILTALAIATNQDRKFQTYILEKFPQYGVGLTKFEDNPEVKKQLVDMTTSNLERAPELIAGGQWFNSESLTLSQLRGKVVLIDFWTYTCINCIRTLPYLKNWYSKYKDKGLVIIGVHTPEFEFEKDPNNVARAIADFGLEYPVMQDNDYATWRAYDNRYWPAKYLIDKDGKIRYTHFGEGAYDETEKVIQELLGSTGTINNPKYSVGARTPELYLGYSRIVYFASPEGIKDDVEAQYSIPKTISRNTFAYGGTWIVGDERAMPTKSASLLLNFDAQEVFLVMRPKPGTTGHVAVSLDGEMAGSNAGEDVENNIVTVDSDRLYKLIKLPSAGAHLLRLDFLDGDLELYAFTFG
ncbi:cytochrome c biogenesis protein DipZ [Candidatus Gottesmanbacteria bacterium]|nr:cytochrome c biogenesis protein DipZ [Candidatus Gottesmanbacteria bacterium]